MEIRPATPLTLRLFGPLELFLAGETPSHRLSQGAKHLLALLTLRQKQATERDRLAALLWPESDEANALFYLRRSLNELRHTLGSEAGCILTPTPRSLRLDLTQADCDLVTFDRCLAAGDTASLEQAITLYRAPLLEGWTEEWLLADRLDREMAYLSTLETLAHHALSRDDAPTAIRLLRRVIAADPSREHAQCRLMEALAATGDYAAIVEAYRAFRLYLHEELNATPATKTIVLYRHLREQGRRDQLASHTSSSPHAPRSNADLPPHLPTPLTPLIGREAEITEVVAHLETARLVTLTGTGGIGKTRLALAVGAEVAVDYPDGVWFIDLAPLNDPSLVIQALTIALHLRETPGQSPHETLIAHLKTRHLLLLLDNCEHLVEACAPLVETLLSQCPGLRILTTSRRPLGRIGEVAWRVPSLSLPDPKNPLLREKDATNFLMEYEAIRLFVARVQAVAPRFRLHIGNQQRVADICHRLSGLPLAIELVAARARAMSIEQIATRLADPLNLLTSGSTALLPRQQTLRDTLDWSHALLSEEQQTLLHRLAVFAGGFTLERAEEVCADEGEDQAGGTRPC